MTAQSAAYAIRIKQMLDFRLAPMFLVIAAYPGTFSTAKDASSAMQLSWKSPSKTAAMILPEGLAVCSLFRLLDDLKDKSGVN